MAAPNPSKIVTNPRIAKLIELEVAGRIKPEHLQELNSYRAQGLAPKGASLTESEGKSTGFYTRALGSNKDFEAQPPTAQAGRGLLGDAAASVLPTGVLNSFTSEDRQQTLQAKQDFIRASLRYESGAAIADDEFAGQDRTFFPQTGDSEAVIHQKAEARRRVIESLKASAGDGADKPSLAPSPVAPTATATPSQNVDIGFAGERDTGQSIKQLTPEQNAEYLRIAQTGKPEDLVRYIRSIGFNIENAEDVVKARDEGAGVSTNTTVRRPEAVIDAGDGVTGAALRGVGRTITGNFLDEAGGLVDTVGDAFAGRLKPGGFGDALDANIDRNRAILAGDDKNNGTASLIGQLAGGFALPVIGGEATVANLARTGAVYGAVNGAGASEGGLGARTLGSIAGSTLGAGLGAGLGAAGQRLASRFGGGGGGNPTRAAGREVYEAGQRQGVDVLPADVGGPMARRFTAGAAQSPISSGSILRAGQRVVDQTAAARDRVAAGVGQAADPIQAGEQAAAGAVRAIGDSRARVGRLYDAARNEAGDIRPTAQRAIDTLDANLAELAETPNTSAAVTVALESLGEDLRNPAGLSVDALRRLRTNVRGLSQTDSLRGTDFQRRAGQVLDSISQDIEQGLPQAARDAFRAADTAHRERVELIDQVITPIIGGRGDKAFAPERVFQNIQNATRTDSAKLRRFLEALPEEDRASTVATVIGQLGRATDGAQNAAGTQFSLASFLTQWNKMTPRAKTTLFQGETRAALDDIARIAQGSREAAGYANRSNTGGTNVVSLLLGGGGAAGVGALGSGAVAPLGFAVASNYAAGRLLASPRFARWLARPANNPQQIQGALRRLSAIASREPAIANDLIGVQRRLTTALQSGNAAAKEPGEKR